MTDYGTPPGEPDAAGPADPLPAEPGRAEPGRAEPPLVSRWRPERRAAVAGGVAVLVLAVGGWIVLSGGDEGPAALWRPGRAATPARATPAEDVLTVSGTGDIIMGAGPGAFAPNDGRGFFDGVRESLRSDLQMGNLEQPLTDDTGYTKCPKPSPGPASSGAASPGSASPGPALPSQPVPSPSVKPAQDCFAFRTPASFAGALRDGGFRVLNLANNHSYDFGPEGYRHTTAALDSVGLSHIGAPGEITVINTKGVRVAVLGFSPFSGTQNVLDIDGAVRLVKRAREQADLVIVQMQHGAEGADQTHTRPGPETYLGENRGDSMRFAHAVVDAGAQLVIGHGPHVMRGMEFYRGRLIAYSLGNFAGYRSLAYTGVVGVGGILKVGLRKDGSYVSGTLVASHMVAPGLPALDPQQQALPLVRGLSDTDFPATGARIGPDGSISPR